MERDGRRARPRQGLELILPDWFYAGVLNEALVLTIDRAYFDLTGGLSAGSIVWCASTAVARRAAGVLTLCICTPNPAASHRSSILPTTCAKSSAGRHCPAINSSSRMTRAAQSG